MFWWPWEYAFALLWRYIAQYARCSTSIFNFNVKGIWFGCLSTQFSKYFELYHRIYSTHILPYNRMSYSFRTRKNVNFSRQNVADFISVAFLQFPCSLFPVKSVLLRQLWNKSILPKWSHSLTLMPLFLVQHESACVCVEHLPKPLKCISKTIKCFNVWMMKKQTMKATKKRSIE